MNHPTNNSQLLNINPLKVFLLLVSTTFTLVASALVFACSLANGGSATSQLVTFLTGKINTGLLITPGEQSWFKLTPQSSNRQQPLNLKITSNKTNTITLIAGSLFEDNQIKPFDNGHTANMVVCG